MSAILCDKCLKDKLIYILRTLGTESQHRCSRGYLYWKCRARLCQ